MSVSDKFNALLQEAETPKPQWQGPTSNTPQGGITFSMLSRYLVCKERFRIYAMEGIRAKPAFNHRLEFGNMWHKCEEAYASEIAHFGEYVGTTIVEDELLKYTVALTKKYPLQQEDILKWYNVCKVQFPIYLEYWDKREKEFKYQSLGPEQVFCVPYSLPSGRVVYLRGKIDDVLKSLEPTKEGVYIKDHKTKADIDSKAITTQLSFDLQTMMYIHAVNESKEFGEKLKDLPILGVVYNIVRRPLSGGKGTIVRHKASKNKPEESYESYYNRLKDIIKEEPEHYFMRWQMDVSGEDLTKFLRVCLDPILENLCDDYEWWADCWYNGVKEGYDQFSHNVREEAFEYHSNRHYIYPNGIWNPLADGYECDVDNYMRTGDMSGMVKNAPLFEELNATNP